MYYLPSTECIGPDIDFSTNIYIIDMYVCAILQAMQANEISYMKDVLL